MFECTVDGANLTCTCRYTSDDDTSKAKKGFHDLEVRFFFLGRFMSISMSISILVAISISIP